MYHVCIWKGHESVTIRRSRDGAQAGQHLQVVPQQQLCRVSIQGEVHGSAPHLPQQDRVEGRRRRPQRVLEAHQVAAVHILSSE
jgi:hypothetical protein